MFDPSSTPSAIAQRDVVSPPIKDDLEIFRGVIAAAK